MASVLRKLGSVSQYYGLLMDIVAALEALREDGDPEGIFQIRGVKYGGRTYSLFFTVRRER